MSQLKDYCNYIIDKMVPEEEVNLNDLLDYSICPYCDCKVISTDPKKTIVIAYCPLCDIVWKINYLSKYDHCIINEMEFAPYFSDDSE